MQYALGLSNIVLVCLSILPQLRTSTRRDCTSTTYFDDNITTTNPQNPLPMMFQPLRRVSPGIRSSFFVFLSVVLIVSMISPVSAGLRDSFTSVGKEAKANMKLDNAGATNGLSREMFLMKDKLWEIHPADFSGMKDKDLKSHCEKFLSRPVIMKPSNRPGKYGYKASGTIVGRGKSPGKKLKGCYWRQRDGNDTRGTDLLKIPYDEAVRQTLPTIEFEVQLPPLRKKGGKSKPKRVTVVYSVAVEGGAMNPKSMVPRGSGSVKILPDGHRDGAEAETLTLPSKAYVGIPQGAGLIDRAWARGNIVFRRGRPTGPV